MRPHRRIDPLGIDLTLELFGGVARRIKIMSLILLWFIDSVDHPSSSVARRYAALGGGVQFGWP